MPPSFVRCCETSFPRANPLPERADVSVGFNTDVHMRALIPQPCLICRPFATSNSDSFDTFLKCPSPVYLAYVRGQFLGRVKKRTIGGRRNVVTG